MAVSCERVKIVFFVRSAKIYFFGVPQNFNNQSVCAMRGKRLKITALEVLNLPVINGAAPKDKAYESWYFIHQTRKTDLLFIKNTKSLVNTNKVDTL